VAPARKQRQPRLASAHPAPSLSQWQAGVVLANDSMSPSQSGAGDIRREFADEDMAKIACTYHAWCSLSTLEDLYADVLDFASWQGGMRVTGYGYCYALTSAAINATASDYDYGERLYFDRGSLTP